MNNQNDKVTPSGKAVDLRRLVMPLMNCPHCNGAFRRPEIKDVSALIGYVDGWLHGQTLNACRLSELTEAAKIAWHNSVFIDLVE